MASTKLCICATCGLPASGKSSLCRLISELATVQGVRRGGRSLGMTVVHVCYDEVIPQNLDPKTQLNTSENSQNHSLWKEYRNQIVECLDFVIGELSEKRRPLHQIIADLQISSNTTEAIKNISTVQKDVWLKLADCLSKAEAQMKDEENRLLFLIDDNMFYRSMRYNLFQLARKYSTGFCQIGFDCSQNIAISRNARRNNGILEDTIITMATKLELPDASKASWEENSILIDADEQVDHAILAPVWMMLQASFLTPVPPLIQEDLEAKEQSRVECAASLIHQADQAIRKYISETMSTSKGKLSSTELKDLASELNRGKTAILDDLRRGTLTPPHLPQDEQPRKDFEDFFKDLLKSHLAE